MAPYLGFADDGIGEVPQPVRGSAPPPTLPYIYTLTENDKLELHEALQGFLDLELNGDQVGPENFILPTLGQRLKNLTLELHQGRGLFVIRGLQLEDYSEEDNLTIYLGVSSYIGALRGKQTDDGSVLGHLYSPAAMFDAQANRPIKYSKHSAEFHNDIGCDILAMQTRSTAAVGGSNLYASIAQIYHHIALVRPDLADQLLAPDWPFNIQRRWAATTRHAVLFKHEDRILSALMPDALLGPPGTRGTDSPCNLTSKQCEALAFLQDVATSFQLRIRSEPGDMTYVNNRSIIHGRDAFEDSPENTRYLVRLWLKNEKLAWCLPPALKIANHMVFHDKVLQEKWNISRLDNVKFQVYERHTP